MRSGERRESNSSSLLPQRLLARLPVLVDVHTDRDDKWWSGKVITSLVTEPRNASTFPSRRIVVKHFDPRYSDRPYCSLYQFLSDIVLFLLSTFRLCYGVYVIVHSRLLFTGPCPCRVLLHRSPRWTQRWLRLALYAQ